MEVVDVDAFELQVAQAAGELIFQKARRHAMAAGDEVFGREDAWLNYSRRKYSVVSAGMGRLALIAAFCANDEFVTGETFCGELFDGCADAAFAALEAVVDGGVEKLMPLSAAATIAAA